MEGYSRPVYVVSVATGVAALEFAAGFGTAAQASLAYAAAFALGGVVFYQSEVPVTVGSVIGNFLLAGFLGTLVSLAVSAGLLMYFLGAPWDLSLWRAGVRLWGAWVGILASAVVGLFLVGLIGSFVD